jgi:hypothetical protein
MDQTHSLQAVEITELRLRCRRAEDRLRALHTMLDALGITLWQTDGELRLIDSCGLMLAETYQSCHIGDFFRDVYGLAHGDDEPLAAHREARRGRRTTLHLDHGGKRYAILVDPRLNRAGEVIGTVGMSLQLGAV